MLPQQPHSITHVPPLCRPLRPSSTRPSGDDDAMTPPRTPDGISTSSSHSGLPRPTATICLYWGDDDDCIKDTGVVDHFGLGGEGHDGDGGPRGGVGIGITTDRRRLTSDHRQERRKWDTQRRRTGAGRMIAGTPSLAASIGGDRRRRSKIVAGDNDTCQSTVEVIIKKISRLLG